MPARRAGSCRLRRARLICASLGWSHRRDHHRQSHPGAQLDVFDERDGYRYQAVATDTGVGQLAFLEARHRDHARVEDRILQIRRLQDAGQGRLPSRGFAINQVWLELALTAADLLAWTQTTLFTATRT